MAEEQYELDQFVKHILKCRFYIRYVDDFILVSPYREQLTEWRKEIEGFLEKRLALRLKSRGKIKRVSEGADFLGYIVRPGYMLARKRVVNNLKYRLAMFRDKMVNTYQINDMNLIKMVMRHEIVMEMTLPLWTKGWRGNLSKRGM